MKNCIGLRKETKDETERRVPLTPLQVKNLIQEFGIKVIVEPSEIRIFKDKEYEEAGAIISKDFSECNIIFGIKEVPINEFAPEKPYCFFSHTIKAQSYNMKMLKTILNNKNTLLDYELVKGDDKKRIIYFGNFAGYAGIIDSLWALGQRYKFEGLNTPFKDIKLTWEYKGLEDAKSAIQKVGEIISKEGLPKELTPFICGFTGTGRVSKGAQHIYDLLPTQKIKAEELKEFIEKGEFSNKVLYKVEFRKAHMYTNKIPNKKFECDDYLNNPDNFKGIFEYYIPYLNMIINGIYWEDKYPKLITKDYLKEYYKNEKKPKLKVIGDITCDIGGSIETTIKSTKSQNPVFVYEPLTDNVIDGFEGNGPVTMAVDKLPTELPAEASEFFGNSLYPYIYSLANADFENTETDKLDIPEEIRKSIIVQNGSLTKSFLYLKPYIENI